MVVLAGTHATLGDKPRQARKGAAVVADAGAVVLLVETPPYLREEEWLIKYSHGNGVRVVLNKW